MFSSILRKFIDAHVPWYSFEISPKILCASHSQSSFLIIYFCIHMLFYALCTTGCSLVDNWKLFVNFCFHFFFFAENFCFRFNVRRKFFTLSVSGYHKEYVNASGIACFSTSAVSLSSAFQNSKFLTYKNIIIWLTFIRKK